MLDEQSWRGYLEKDGVEKPVLPTHLSHEVTTAVRKEENALTITFETFVRH